VTTTAAPEVRQWRLGPRGERWFDVVLATALLLPVAVYVTISSHWGWLLAAASQLVPLYWRRAHPVPVFAVVAASSAVQALLVDVPLWSQVAFPVAVYSVARYARTAAGIAALLVGLAGAGVASYVWLSAYDDPVSTAAWVSYLLTISTIVVTAWALGTLSRTRRAYVDALVERGHRLELEAGQRAELAAADERARIAREMHDVVAHGLSVIVVQADGARYAAAHDPQAATAALETISETGRDALTEMRRMLGLLRSGAQTGTTPQPRLADIATLVEEARAAGATVEAALPEGDPDVPDGVALTAYRVAQEALSNVRKHAGPSARTMVSLDVRDVVEVLVEDDGRGAATPDPDDGGLGLLGMRERVAAHGGVVEAGPRPGGGYRVRARIPR
jgi:signal transduction histidine kinase